MKKQFLSNGTSSVPRVWQLLMTMVFLFTLGIGQMWAGLPLKAIPNGTNLLKTGGLTTWTTGTKNTVIYDDENYFMAWSNGNALVIDGTGFKIGNSSKKSALVFYVANPSDISVGIARNGSDMTASLHYMGTSISALTDPNNDSDGGGTQCDELSISSSSSTGTLSMTAGAAGYYKVFGTLRFYATSITIDCITPTNLSIGGGGEYTVGTDMGFELSVPDNVDEYTTYTWYKGNTWDAAKVTTPVQAAKTEAQSGRYLHINPCALTDAGTYWCSAANGTCEAHASVTVTVVPAGGTKYDIIYQNTKGATNTNPAQYTKGVGIASFEPLPDVEGFHFASWNPTFISDAAAGNKTVIANWVPTFNVSFDKGAGSGTAPAGFQKWEGAKFNLPGQGDMVAPSGKVFDGWKVGVSEKYAAGAEYTMGTTGVEFVAQWKNTPTVLFHYNMGNVGAAPADGTENSATGGKILFRNAKMSKESSSFNAAVTGDMIGGANSLKIGGNADSIRINLTTGNFQEGDTIFITGYNPFVISTTPARDGNVATSVTTGTSKTDYNIGYCVIPAGIDTKYLYIGRVSSSCGFAAIKVIRPAARDIASTVISLTDVKVNDHSISADSLAILLAAGHSLMLKDEFTVAPVIKFNQHTKIIYADGKEPATKESDKVYTVTATTVAGNWQAQQEINSVTYTVNATKVSSAKVYYYDGSNKLGEEVVALYENPANYATYQAKVQLASFVDWYNNADLAEEHKIADISAMQVTGDINVYGKWTPLFATSVNMEKLVMQNGKGYGLMAQMGAQYYASNITGDLDSLSVKADSLRNYSYLGLKVKKSGGLLNFRLAKDNTVKIKFGNVATTPQVSINDGAYAAITITDHVYSYTAEADAYISIKMMDGNAVVFQQIMIGEDIQAPELYPVSYSPAKETTAATDAHGHIDGLLLGIPGETIKVYPKADAGYIPSSVTVNGVAITPSAGVYSFTMPSEAVTVAATFAVPSFTVTYNANNGSSDMHVDTDAATILDNTFTYADHIFLGWNTAADGSGVAYAVGATVTDNLVLHAQWLEFTGCFYFGAKSVTADEAITAPATLSTTILGGSVEATSGTFTYTTAGVLIAGSSGSYFTVTLDYALMEGSKIAVKMYAGGTSARGLNLRVAGSSDNVYQYKWDPSATEPAQMLFEEEYEVPANSPLIGKKVFYLYRNNNVYLQTVTVKNCAPQDYTVTYKDGETTLGTEQVFENAHPTADGINTHKKGYEFQGWAETADGAVVDLDDITITAAKNLFAQYTVKDCSPMGVKFSMAIDGSKISANQYYPNTTPAVGDLAVFATVSGGLAQAVNTSTGTTKNFEVKTTPEFKLGGANSHMRILLDCPLAENDTIKFDKTEKIKLSFDSLKTSAKTVSIAKTTSYYVVPAAYAGEDTIHIWYDNSGVSVNGVQVIRPEVYTVSFDLMGHGSAIAPMDVVKGGKIAAPTAPTDADYAFAGWYKENTLSSAWDFDNDVVEAATTLYAKWLDKSDATLKSLKFGTTDIALEDGVFVYNINLPALSTAVPALIAETNNPNASALVADAAAFDGEGHATSTVTVTPQKAGAAEQVYTVNFSKAAAVELQDVTGSITWNFANAVSGTVNITGTPIVLANYGGVTNDATFESDKLEASGEKFTAGSKPNLRANYIRFHTTVPGKLSISYSNTGGNAARFIYVNGAKYDEEGSANTTPKGIDTKVFVPAGDVELVMKDGEDVSKNVQIYQMIFDATPDYTRSVSNYIGTLCVDHNVPAGQYFGATFYQIAGRNATYPDKLDFDELAPDEELKAGEPYIFQSTTGRIDLFYGATVVEDSIVVNGMHGVLVGGNLPITEDNMMDVLYISENKLHNCSNLIATGLTLVANRAYIVRSEVDAVTSAPAPGRRRLTIGGSNAPQITTDLMNLNAGEKPVKMIIDGKLYILRGEKMFDVTGKLVK